MRLPNQARRGKLVTRLASPSLVVGRPRPPAEIRSAAALIAVMHGALAALWLYTIRLAERVTAGAVTSVTFRLSLGAPGSFYSGTASPCRRIAVRPSLVCVAVRT